jgi:hypothetical protein
VLIVGALLIGLVARSVVADGSDSPLLSWLPWNRDTSVTFFYGDAELQYLVPVTRSVDRNTGPAELVDLLLAGPASGSGLVPLIPVGTEAAVDFADGDVTVDLSGAYWGASSPLAAESLYQSIRSWPDVSDVLITVEESPLETNTSGHLLYWYDEGRDRLVAQVTNQIRPDDVLEAYLAGPPDPDLIGLPAEVDVVGVELGANELLTLRFTFPDALRSFAVDHPDSVRRVLEGLIATFNTGFPGVGGVLLDFEGHNALGLGQCANLLNTVQQMPDVLNDERLLTRSARDA